MAYFRTIPKLGKLLEILARDDRWLILINADPDAMASAMALKRIFSHKVQETAIAKVNEVTRPDNLAMIRYTHLHMDDYTPSLGSSFNRFALVDSQPQHHPFFKDIDFSIIIDHHPVQPEPLTAAYSEIKPEYGATSTILTEYLYNLDIRPGKLLATALQFGIKTDTASFERHFIDVDFRAYQHLGRFAGKHLLSRIARSEFHIRWLDFFAKACTNMYSIGTGQYVYLGSVDNPDLLVIIADFLMRVFEIRWVAIAGEYQGGIVIIFRSDGVSRDVGACAAQLFGPLGSAGGHKAMARAEFPLEAANGADPELFIWQIIRKPGRGHNATPENLEQLTFAEPHIDDSENYDGDL